MKTEAAVRTVLMQPVILSGGSDDTVLGQLIELQVIEGLPGTNDGNICRNIKKVWLFTGKPLHIITIHTKCISKWSHRFLSPPFQGYHHQIYKDKISYTPKLAIISKPLKEQCILTLGFPSSEACSWTDGSASVWTWGVLSVGWRGRRWREWRTLSQLWAPQDSFWEVRIPLCRL